MSEVVIKVIGNYSYQTSKCLGEGVYGKVYQGMERQTKEKVAIKKIDLATFTNDKYLQNAIFSEIYLLKRFNHPNIVKFKDVLSSKNSLYIITQFCKNGDLKQMMKRKKFKEDQVYDIVRQILSGFQELIKQKIVHRDLKPANILIHEGVYKIGDFGFAKYVDNFGSQMLKSCVGSPIYMAPQILERVQYTTKCDIWSLGVISYQMLFGYPPWKARDQNELLKGIKTISISHILKRSSLSSRTNQFLKRTLAYSQEERISWADLFEMFLGKSSSSSQKPLIEPKIQPSSAGLSKDRVRLLSNGSTSWSQQQLLNHQQLTPSASFSGRQINQNTLLKDPPQERRTYGGGSNQLENVMLSRQFCIFYHYYLVELFVQLSYIKLTLGHIDLVFRLYHALALLIKYKSTYCISILSIHHKNSKSLEETYKKLKVEHETYEMISNEVMTRLDKEGQLKKIKSQMTQVIGYGDVINEDKTEKIQSVMIKYAHEFAQLVSDEVRRRIKSMKESTMVEILENTVDLLTLGIGKAKALRQLREDVRAQNEDLSDYVTKVINKLDKLASNL